MNLVYFDVLSPPAQSVLDWLRNVEFPSRSADPFGVSGLSSTAHIPRLTLGPPALPSEEGDGAGLGGDESEADILPFALDGDMQLGYESLRGQAAQFSPTG